MVAKELLPLMFLQILVLKNFASNRVLERKLFCDLSIYRTAPRPSASRREFLTKYDRKYLVFGDRTDDEPK